MLTNYLTVAWRNLIHNKTFSALNLFGLATGLACSLLIFLWVRDELSVDRYHANGPHLYRLLERQLSQGKREALKGTPGELYEVMPKQFPEIVYATTFSWQRNLSFKVGDKLGKEMGRWAGKDWFSMFSIPLLAGSPETALSSPTSIAISRRLAESYFGSPQAAIGKSIRIDNKLDYQVTAVFENLPANTSEKYNFLLPWQDFLRLNPWARANSSSSATTLLQLRPDANAKAFEAKIRHYLRGYNPDIDLKNLRQFDIELFLQPYGDGYLYGETENGEISGGRIEYVRLFSLVAVFILLIAAINFMNLSTARSLKRAKEVGIRKVVGASRSGLMAQFMGEAALITFISILVALLLIAILLSSFNQLTGKNIGFPHAEPAFLLLVGGVGVLTALLAGSYPALLLSSFQPIKVLKGSLRFGSGVKRFRQGLVVVQFVLSLLMIIGTLVVSQQVRFMQTKNIGFERENLIYVPLEGELLTRYEAVQQVLKTKPGIASVTWMSSQPTEMDDTAAGDEVDWKGKDPKDRSEFTQVRVGYDLTSTLKLKLVEGREFSPRFRTDSLGYVINELAARQMGYDHPVGQPLTLFGRAGTIVGVVKDFHFLSLHEPIKPLIIWQGKNTNHDQLLVRTLPGKTDQALQSLESVCKTFNPAFPFTYSFADQEYQQMYQSEQVISTLITYFAGLAIFIACLGLFGLASFSAEQRTREIGVRKVLGASVSGIVGLLAKEFLKLVVFAIGLSTPLAWWALNEWLKDYPYRVPLSAWVFVLAGVVAMAIAFFTVSFQTIRAALANPVDSLRSE
jgi:predicted permease